MTTGHVVVCPREGGMIVAVAVVLGDRLGLDAGEFSIVLSFHFHICKMGSVKISRYIISQSSCENTDNPCTLLEISYQINMERNYFSHLL